MTAGSPRTNGQLVGDGPKTGKRAAVLGAPIAHSLSPVLHRAAYAALGLPGWAYDAYLVEETTLPAFFKGIEPERERWAGLSLTMPLKRAVVPLLDSISDTAAAVEAVNTVLFDQEGRRTGENTDIPGMVAALRERGVTHVTSAAVLGSGATACSALAALARMGGESSEVTAYVRGQTRAARMRRMGDHLGMTVSTAPWEHAAEALRADLVLATTPAGTTDELAKKVPDLPGALFDVVYAPWPTRLAATWAERGGRVVGGLDLLVHQAVLQVELMTGLSPGPLAAMRAAGEAVLATP